MKIKIGILLIIPLFVSGCLNLNKNSEDNSWKDEILMAQKCGMDGLRCCTDPENSCHYGQACCVDPNDFNNNYCADECVFGIKDKFCRVEKPKCDNGLACASSRCVDCGSDNQPCCSNESCSDGLVCTEGKCGQCGLTGNPCCVGEQDCLYSNRRDGERSECQNNICVLCGASSNIACQNEPICNQGNLRNNNLCFACGGFNQPCCQKNEINNYVCDPKLGLKCNMGFCSK